PFTHGRAFESFYAQHAGVKLLYQLGLLALGYAFFGGFWTHGGQTIGMRTWYLRVVRLDGAPLNWYCALIRYLTMLIPWMLLLLGSELLLNAHSQSNPGLLRGSATVIFLLALAAFLWSAFNPRRLAWHDHLSGTRLVLLPKICRVKPD
ncbi:MAG: RDD family protein, partial [Gammaproteobacteria bacterium]